MTNHISELAIDKWLAGELDGTALRAHAADCARCKLALDDAEAAKASFAGEMPALLLPTHIRPARKTSRVWLAAPALAAAAVVALVWAWPRSPSEQEPVETVRMKGGAIAGMYVSHAGVVRTGSASEMVMPGDRLAFVTTTTTPMWFAVISDDAAGVRSVYVKPTRVEAGRERELPLSIELDDALGGETVTAVFCDSSFDVQLPLPAGCTSEKFTLTKVRQ